MNPFDWIAARAAEPSTWAGIAGLVSSMSFWPAAPTVATAIVPVGAAISSVLAIVMAEAKNNLAK